MSSFAFRAAFTGFVAALLCLGVGLCGAADAYPNKPVRLIVPTSAGSSPDLNARRLAEQLSKRWKQQVVIDNRPGAGTTIGARAVADATPDGYTLLYAPFNTLAVNPYLPESVPYDPIKSFAPVSLLLTASFALAVHESVPARNFAEFVAYGRKNPGALKFGGGGPGTPQQILGELLNRKAGLGGVYVAYKSAPPAVTDLLGGHLQFMFEAFATTIDHVKAGRLRYLAVTSKARIKALPDIPTLSELGISDEDWTLWAGIVAPARTPADRVRALSVTVRDIVASGALGEPFLGMDWKTSSPEEFRSFIAAEIPKWRRLVELAGAKGE